MKPCGADRTIDVGERFVIREGTAFCNTDLFHWVDSRAA